MLEGCFVDPSARHREHRISESDPKHCFKLALPNQPALYQLGSHPAARGCGRKRTRPVGLADPAGPDQDQIWSWCSSRLDGGYVAIGQMNQAAGLTGDPQYSGQALNLAR